MTKIFSKPVRVNDFIANTVNLSNENIGIYIRLLFYAWENKAMLWNIEEDIFEITKAYDKTTQEKVYKIFKKQNKSSKKKLKKKKEKQNGTV